MTGAAALQAGLTREFSLAVPPAATENEWKPEVKILHV